MTRFRQSDSPAPGFESSVSDASTTRNSSVGGRRKIEFLEAAMAVLLMVAS